MPRQANLFYFQHQPASARQPPLVLIHGAAGTHLSWPPQIRRLPGYAVLAVDLPGHGRSAGAKLSSIGGHVDALCAWLDELHIQSAIFGGHSMGGAIALSLALDHPWRIGGLVLVGTGASLRVHQDLLDKCSNPATFHQAVELITKWSFGRTTSRGLVELAEKRMAETPPQVLHGDLLACDAFDVRARLPQITCPTLVICGEEDRMTPLREARLLADHIPGAALRAIPDCGHMVMLERPELVAQEMGRFLGGLAACHSSGVGNHS